MPFFRVSVGMNHLIPIFFDMASHLSATLAHPIPLQRANGPKYTAAAIHHRRVNFSSALGDPCLKKLGPLISLETHKIHRVEIGIGFAHIDGRACTAWPLENAFACLLAQISCRIFLLKPFGRLEIQEKALRKNISCCA